MSERGFLGRWSGRKRAAREEERREEERPVEDRRPDAGGAGDPNEALPNQAGTVADAPPGAEPISEEELAQLPPVEEAESSADLRPYLRRGVPPELRRAALRRMWSLNPAIRDYVDPALDYAWDFNAPATGQATAAARVASLLGAAVRDAAVDRVGGGRAGPSRAESRQETPSESGIAPLPHPEPPPEGTDHHQSVGAPGPAEHASGRRRRHGGAVPRTLPGGGAGGGPDGTSDGV